MLIGAPRLPKVPVPRLQPHESGAISLFHTQPVYPRRPKKTIFAPVTASPSRTLSRIETLSKTHPRSAKDATLQNYVANLQGQIHLLEMEIKILKEKVAKEGSGRGPLSLGADDVDIEVDPTMRELRLMYLKLEKDWTEEQKV